MAFSGVPGHWHQVFIKLSTCLVVLMFFESKVLSMLMAAMIFFRYLCSTVLRLSHECSQAVVFQQTLCIRVITFLLSPFIYLFSFSGRETLTISYPLFVEERQVWDVIYIYVHICVERRFVTGQMDHDHKRGGRIMPFKACVGIFVLAAEVSPQEYLCVCDTISKTSRKDDSLCTYSKPKYHI